MFQDWLKGKKTIIVACVAAASIVLTACGVPIPPYVQPILTWLGVGAGAAKVQRIIEGDRK